MINEIGPGDSVGHVKMLLRHLGSDTSKAANSSRSSDTDTAGRLGHLPWGGNGVGQWLSCPLLGNKVQPVPTPKTHKGIDSVLLPHQRTLVLTGARVPGTGPWTEWGDSAPGGAV